MPSIFMGIVTWYYNKDYNNAMNAFIFYKNVSWDRNKIL